MSENARTDASADAEFDRLQALYDALYNLLTPEQRATFFSGLVPPLAPAEPVADLKPPPRDDTSAKDDWRRIKSERSIIAIADDVDRLGPLINAIILMSRSMQDRSDANSIEWVAINAEEIWRRVKNDLPANVTA